jgi:zinc protease
MHPTRPRRGRLLALGLLILGPLTLGMLALPALVAVPAAPAHAQGEVETHMGFFPWPVHREVLDNGLHVLVIPTPEFENVLSYNAMVLAGARNETVKRQSGLAHLFEHLMFRHMLDGEVNGYDRVIGEMGAFNNAWTWFDVTYYRPLTFTENLEQLNRLESDRFVNLDFTEKTFKTEAGAVYGEYRNSASNPGLRMSEVYLSLMYGDYGYGHTTIGYLEDVEDMPNEYEAALKFYQDFYRPNNTLHAYGDWQAAELPGAGEAPAVGGPKRDHVDWPVDVPPRVQVCYRMPPHRTGSVETAVGQILPELLVSETAPLYVKLRSEKQVASNLSLSSAPYEAFGPGPFVLTTTLYKSEYEEQGETLIEQTIADVEQALQDLKTFSERADAAQTLEALKSKYQYDLLAELESPADAASTFAWYYRFERDLQVFDKLVGSVKALTPADVDALAQRIFVPENQVIVTLTGGGEGAR